ncbi:hypothetical protein BDW71DRAFT_173738 [Aspergillus fruticulosus]
MGRRAYLNRLALVCSQLSFTPPCFDQYSHHFPALYFDTCPIFLHIAVYFPIYSLGALGLCHCCTFSLPLTPPRYSMAIDL